MAVVYIGASAALFSAAYAAGIYASDLPDENVDESSAAYLGSGVLAGLGLYALLSVPEKFNSMNRTSEEYDLQTAQAIFPNLGVNR